MTKLPAGLQDAPELIREGLEPAHVVVLALVAILLLVEECERRPSEDQVGGLRLTDLPKRRCGITEPGLAAPVE